MTEDNLETRYQRRWGDWDSEAYFERDGGGIRVLKWQPSDATLGVALYVTIGSSNLPPVSGEPTHRREFFIGLLPEFDAIVEPLAELAIYPKESGKDLDHGHFVRIPGGAVPGAAFEGFVILEPMDDMDLMRFSDRHVQLMMVVPAFPKELDYASKKGVDRLMERMEKQSAPYWDPMREPIFY